MSSNPKRTSLDVGANTYWRKLLIEYDSDGDIIYFGTHVDYDADDTDTSHVVKKFTLDSSKNITKIQTVLGSWSSRVSLF